MTKTLKEALGAAPPPPPPKQRRKWRTKYEPWMSDVVSRAILDGMPLKTISGLVRVKPAILTEWLRAGSDEMCQDEDLIDFAVAVNESYSEAIRGGVATMKIHANADWRAADRLLAALDPETFGLKTQKVDVTLGPKPVDRDYSALTDEQLAEYERLDRLATSAAERKRLGPGG